MTKLSTLSEEERIAHRKKQVREAQERFRNNHKDKDISDESKAKCKGYFKKYYSNNKERILSSLREKYLFKKEQKTKEKINKIKEEFGIDEEKVKKILNLVI